MDTELQQGTVDVSRSLYWISEELSRQFKILFSYGDLISVKRQVLVNFTVFKRIAVVSH